MSDGSVSRRTPTRSPSTSTLRLPPGRCWLIIPPCSPEFAPGDEIRERRLLRLSNRQSCLRTGFGDVNAQRSLTWVDRCGRETRIGQFLVFTQQGHGGNDAMLLRLDGDRPVEPLIQADANEQNAVLSADRGWVAYQSSESGRDEVYVRSLPDVNVDRFLISSRRGLGHSGPRMARSSTTWIETLRTKVLASSTTQARAH